MDPYAYARSPFWKETLRCARLKRPQNLAMHLSFLPMPFSSWLSSPCIVCRPLSFLYRCDASTRPDPTAHLIMCVGDRAEIWMCRWTMDGVLFLSWRLLLKCNMQDGIHASHLCTSGQQYGDWYVLLVIYMHASISIRAVASLATGKQC
jgi:hypothetical protein